MATRQILTGSLIALAVSVTPAAAQVGIPGECHLMLKPGYGASLAEHARYQTEIAACLAQPVPPKFRLSPLDYGTVPQIDVLGIANRAAERQRIQAQTEALRAETAAMRAQTAALQAARTQPEVVAPVAGDVASPAQKAKWADNERWLHLASATLASAPSAEVWRARRLILRQQGAPGVVLDLLGDYSPIAAKYAKDMATVLDGFVVEGK